MMMDLTAIGEQAKKQGRKALALESKNALHTKKQCID